MLAAPMSRSPSAAQHYARQGALTGRILSALTAADKDIEALSVEDLAPFDQLHSRGQLATVELAQILSPQVGQRLLDLGCGIGGPARWLAVSCGCEVVGLDLTEAYCRTARDLSARVQLDRFTCFLCADALQLPFAAASFDLVWSQHAAMNIADKATLYREVARVLKPGGRFGLYDIMAGQAGPPHFPVPWASEAAWNHLLAPEGVRAAILATGLRQRHWRDLTAETKAWSEKAAAAQAAGKGPAGQALILGPDFVAMFANLRRSLLEDRLTVVQAVFDKPASANLTPSPTPKT